MAKPGRPSNLERERRAAEAAQAAERATQVEQVKPELPLETSAPIDQGEPEERSHLVRVPPRNENRRLAMEEVEARDLDTKGKLGMELGIPDDEKQAKVPEKHVQPDLPPPTAESMLQGGKFSTPQVKVRVDGEDFDVSQEEIDQAGGVKNFQIQRAAENRLRQANEALAEIRKLHNVPRETLKEAPDDLLKKEIETLRWGTPEESAAALKRILTAQNKPVDHNMIVEMAADRIRHDDAVKAFDKEFKDIGASQMHLKLVVALRNEVLQKGHPGDWEQFYRSLGNQVRAVMPKSGNGTTSQTPDKSTTDTTSQPSDKEARKSSIVNLPTAATRAAVPEEPKTETRADTLNSMRKARGLPTL